MKKLIYLFLLLGFFGMVSELKAQDGEFTFQVKMGEREPCTFAEVTGLDIDTDVIEYRNDNSEMFSTTKMPGISKFQNVTLKRGVINNDNNLYDWYERIKLNTIARETIVITMMDLEGNALQTWTLVNAMPIKISDTNLESEANEILIEILEFAHEGIIVSRP